MNITKMLLIAVFTLSAAAQTLRAGEAEAPGAPISKGTAKTQVQTPKAMAAGLVAGYRGTSIALPGDQLLYLKKGDRVDVLVTFAAKKEKDVQETLTATILQNVIVINVVKPEKVTGTGAVELLLNPNEAQYLALSVSQAKTISIAVRAPGDVELHPMEMASFRKLIK